MKQPFQPFLMERMMSRFEQDVEYNLSESGVHPLRVQELLDQAPELMEELLASDFNYPHVNGIPRLRQNIAALYDGATPANVLVTVGAIEANYISVNTLLSEGDEIVIMLPNYMQIWGVAINQNFRVKTFHLREDRDWAPDLDELAHVVTPNTRLIAVCHPNNPTGHALTEPEMQGIIEIAESVGAWILADEVYSGAERVAEQQTPSFYGRYPKVIAIGSMSKAYGMPGLRVGWVVAPAPLIDDIWARHEYVTISAGKLDNIVAAMALSPRIRPWLLQRTRRYIRQGYPLLESWMNEHPGVFSIIPPDAAAIAFVRYHLDINSSELADRLRTEKSVLIVPGDHFGMDHFVRISYGLPRDYLLPALDRIHDLIRSLT
ncbi:MAG: aminotransferase class I/II-fold pyridoxal phosphate-dependent enzyme [Caldilineae bacterium]|nr:MAG: aminotransferase class I/II-fold pyridoxal phosphate-dependent enzyme [Caldilineae bacterium]